MKNYNQEINLLIKNYNYKNLELHEIVNIIRRIKWVKREELEQEVASWMLYSENKHQNNDHPINKKIANILKTRHVPKEIWDDIWFLKIKDFRNFKIVLCTLIELENKVELKKQLEYIKAIKNATWLTIHSTWKSYLYSLVIFEKQYKIKRYDECVVFDIEFDMQDGKEQIIEISALKIKNNEIKQTFSKLIRNNFRLGYKFMEITGIKPEQLKYKQKDTQVLKEFFNFIKDCDVLVGFAIKHNDLPILKRFDITKKLNNFDLSSFKILDLQEYLATQKHEQRSLQYYLEQMQLEVEVERLHRAENDCIIMYEILLHLGYQDIVISKTEL